jgi:hypothetical protein
VRVSKPRRQLLKGGLLAPPVLMTLPRGSVAASSLALQKVGVGAITIELCLDNQITNFMSITRPVYTITGTDGETTQIVAVGDLSSSACQWVTIALSTPNNTWDVGLYLSAAPYPSGSCTGGVLSVNQQLQASTGDMWTVQSPAPTGDSFRLLIGVDSSGNIQAIGPNDSPTNLTYYSSWASVYPNPILPPA